MDRAGTSIRVRRLEAEGERYGAPPAGRAENAHGRPSGDERAGQGDWREEYLRLAAEIDNTKKRLARDADRRLQEEQERLFADMLPVADNLERMLEHAGDGSHPELRRGLRITLQDLMARLRKYHVEPMAAEGLPFDPHWHEAVGAIRGANVPAGTVVKVERRGYRLDGKLLRPARVLIAQ
jgi:molecular chaperone GrpE